MLLGIRTRKRVPAGELCRRAHSLWLTRAFATRKEYPRIPVRAMNRGGFSRLMARPGGPALAERWWAAALEQVDDVDIDD